MVRVSTPGPPDQPPRSGGPAVIPHRYATVRVDDVRPHPRNPNRGDVDGIAESIDGVGFWGALAVHEPTGHILIGAHRWAAARSRGIAELPALLYDVDEPTAQRIMIGDNEWARLARWDMAQLVELLGELRATPEQLVATGFDDKRFAELVAQMTPEPPDQFGEYGDELRTEHKCPSCGYEWSGNPRPGAA